VDWTPDATEHRRDPATCTDERDATDNDQAPGVERCENALLNGKTPSAQKNPREYAIKQKNHVRSLDHPWQSS